jgi:Fe-Mn family superoxide dismutase
MGRSANFQKLTQNNVSHPMNDSANTNSRREFLTNTSKAGLMMGLVGTGIFSSSSTFVHSVPANSFVTGFGQTPLPYDFSALEPMIDAQTMEIHYTKHAAAYASNLASAAAEEKVDTSLPLENVLKDISRYSTKMRNNGGGHYNHELFWSVLSPIAGGKPTGKLEAAIVSSFGSFEQFVTVFENTAKNRFGSGWAWLVLTPERKLVVSSTPNQDNPLMDVAEVKGTPILGLDVWEHAYYLHYQNRRADYVTAFWKIVNWDSVSERLEAAQ